MPLSSYWRIIFFSADLFCRPYILMCCKMNAHAVQLFISHYDKAPSIKPVPFLISLHNRPKTAETFCTSNLTDAKFSNITVWKIHNSWKDNNFSYTKNFTKNRKGTFRAQTFPGKNSLYQAAIPKKFLAVCRLLMILLQIFILFMCFLLRG